jgi:hypothetical protein
MKQFNEFTGNVVQYSHESDFAIKSKKKKLKSITIHSFPSIFKIFDSQLPSKGKDSVRIGSRAVVTGDEIACLRLYAQQPFVGQLFDAAINRDSADSTSGSDFFFGKKEDAVFSCMQRYVVIYFQLAASE